MYWSQHYGQYIFMDFHRRGSRYGENFSSAREEGGRRIDQHWPFLSKNWAQQSSFFCPEVMSLSIEIYDSRIHVSSPPLCRIQSNSKLDLKSVASYLHILHHIFLNFLQLWFFSLSKSKKLHLCSKEERVKNGFHKKQDRRRASFFKWYGTVWITQLPLFSSFFEINKNKTICEESSPQADLGVILLWGNSNKFYLRSIFLKSLKKKSI